MNILVKGRAAQFNPKNRFEKLEIAYPDDETSFNDEKELSKKMTTSFFKGYSRSIVATNDSYDIGFNYSFNPYRGCEHGCIYCYARPTHEFLGFSSGLDFETKIMVKENAPQLLEETFRKRSYKPDLIMFSGDTDCYQPVERKLQLTRKSLEVCLKYRNPVSVITKNFLITRDIDILKEMAQKKLAVVLISITSVDKNLTAKMEPRASTPERRFEAIKLLAENKISVGVNVAPIIPGLNDEEIPKILKSAAESGASFAGRTMLRLPYSVKDLFSSWLEKEFPDRANKILNKIREMRGGKLNSSEFGKRFTGEGPVAESIIDLFDISCKKFGLNKKHFKLSADNFIKQSDSQLTLFD